MNRPENNSSKEQSKEKKMSSILMPAVSTAATKAAEDASKAGIAAIIEIFKAYWTLKNDERRFEKALNADFTSYTATKPIRFYGEPISVDKLIWMPKVKISSSPQTLHPEICSDRKGVLFEGLAGQGKTLILRYMYLCSVRNARPKDQIVPLVIRPKDLSESSSLLDAIRTRLSRDYEIDSPDNLIDRWEKEKVQFLIFIDDFHVLSYDLQKRFEEDVDMLRRKFNDAKIIVGARPGSIVGQLDSFTNVTICPLDSQELRPFFEHLHKLVDGGQDGLVELLCSKLPHKLIEHLTSPLVASIVYFTFRNAERIPESLSELYDEWLVAIFRDHKSFAALKGCSQALAWHWINRDNRIAMSREVASEALASDEHLEMLCSIGLLKLRRDINAVEFCHDRIAEFLAAGFVSREKDERLAKHYYDIMSTDWLTWSGTLSFLYETDRPRFHSWFLKHDLTKLSISIFGTPHLIRKKNVSLTTDVPRFLQLCTISRDAEESQSENLMVRGWLEMGWWARRYRWYELPSFYDELRNCIDLDSLNDSAINGHLALSDADKRGSIDRQKVAALLQKMLQRAQIEWRSLKTAPTKTTKPRVLHG